MKYPKNSSAWAIGTQRRQGFHVRKVVWGLLMAQCEAREGEQIRAATIMVEANFKRRKQVAPELKNKPHVSGVHSDPIRTDP